MNQLDHIRAELTRLKGKPEQPDEIVLHPTVAQIVKLQVRNAGRPTGGVSVKISTDFGTAKDVAGLKQSGKFVGMVRLGGRK